jgi:putative transposase
VGIDVGISALLTTSDGDKVDNPNYYGEAQADLRRKQRKLARTKLGSNNRKKALLAVQKQQQYIANQRKDFLNKLAHDLVKRYDLIALEDLRIVNMVRNKHLGKRILDSGWGYFRQQLADKAASAGRQVVLVNPAYTSKTCSNCGAEFEDLKLSDRWVQCACGLSLDRDHNAALNVLCRAGWDASVSQNVASLPEPMAQVRVSVRQKPPP